MLKNIVFVLLSLFALANTAALHAAEESAAQNLSTQNPATGNAPAEMMPAGTVPVQTASPLQEEMPDPKMTTSQRPVNDNHVDYRHCLELGSNAEIAACAYKNR